GNLNGLAQALENILRNAIGHSAQGGVGRLQGWLENERWHLQLSDEGCGVDESELGCIFKPFARLDEARPGDGGFGLGLSIARGGIALQGGEQCGRMSPPRLRPASATFCCPRPLTRPNCIECKFNLLANDIKYRLAFPVA
uniref:ATP-binding protein n=1 Tax=Pseudomonas yangonensis TaxID=2579922 RepID=UPI001F33E545